MDRARGRSTVDLPDGIVPRWEWRGFGDDFDTADAVLRPLPTERSASSDECYLLSTHADASVKVRDGKIDVKRRLDVDDHGLELWAPTLDADFPLSPTVEGEVLAALGVEVAAPLGAPTPDDLVAELVEGRDDLIATDVHKDRRHYLVDGCMVESTDITVGGTTVRTVTVESPDPAEVLDTLDRLGLADRHNVNVARGLKAMVRFGATSTP